MVPHFLLERSEYQIKLKLIKTVLQLKADLDQIIN